MHPHYHKQILDTVLGPHFDERELRIMKWANVLQDRPRNQMGRPHIHFDDSAFAESEAYIAEEYERLHAALNAGRRNAALRAFGRLLHTRQDFYSHSTWIHNWGETVDLTNTPEDAAPLCLDPLQHPELISGKGGIMWFILWRLPLLGKWFRREYPPAEDTHEYLNLDGPEKGPLFIYSYNAAIRHTVLEWEKVKDQLIADR